MSIRVNAEDLTVTFDITPKALEVVQGAVDGAREQGGADWTAIEFFEKADEIEHPLELVGYLLAVADGNFPPAVVEGVADVVTLGATFSGWLI